MNDSSRPLGLVFATFGSLVLASSAQAVQPDADDSDNRDISGAERVEEESENNAGETGNAQFESLAELQTVEVLGRRSDKRYSDHSFAVTKTEMAILEIPQSISSITSEMIESQGLHRLNDVAPYAAGVNEYSVYNDLTIRGFRSSDDRRVNGMRTYNNFWSQSAIAHLERVEIIKGPGAATFGDASPGGVVNMVTKKPLPETYREGSVSLGSYDHRYAALDTSGPLNESGSVLYRFNIAAEDSGSFRNQVFNETYTAAPSFSFLPAPGTRINLDMVYTEAAGVLDRGQPNVQDGGSLGVVPIEVSITQPGDGIDTIDYSLNLSIDQDLSPNWAVAGSYMSYRYDEELREHRTTNTYLSDTEIELRYNDRVSEGNVDTATVYLTGRFETGPVDHRLVMGVDQTERDDRSVNRSAEGVGVFDVLNPEYERRDVGSYNMQIPSWAPWETFLDTTGYYIHDQLSLGDWKVLGGLRYDEFESYTVSGGTRSPLDSDSQLSPRLSVTRTLGGNRSVYGSWITGFEPEAGWTEADGGPFDPSDSELFEIGYKHEAFDERLLFTAALYELTKNNIVVYANDPDNPQLYRQRGQERARGLELEANGRITDRFRLIANYAYNDVEVTEDVDATQIGRAKENAPEHMATLWGRYDLGHGFGVGAGVEHVSERRTFEENLTLPEYTLFDAGLYYTGEDYRVSLLVKNLTDEVHWTGGYNFGRVFPGDPRTVRLNVGYEF